MKESFMEGPINLRELGNLVQKRLEEQGLTLREAAKLSGISFPTLSRVKNCKSVPDTTTLVKLSTWLGIPIDELLQAPHQFTLNNGAQPESSFVKGSIGVHFRGKRKQLEASSNEVKETLAKITRFAYEQFLNK